MLGGKAPKATTPKAPTGTNSNDATLTQDINNMNSSVNTPNPYLTGTPGAPAGIYNPPSQGQINASQKGTENQLMQESQPGINEANNVISSGINNLQNQKAGNVSYGNQQIGLQEGLANNMISNLQKGYNQYETNAQNAMLAGQTGTENLMREQQTANIGATTAAQGQSGFTSGIGQGDPFTQAEIAAQNQPYYQQLTNLNAQTQSQIGQMAANMYQSLGGQEAALTQNESAQIAGIANNIVSQNTNLSQAKLQNHI